MKHIPNKKAIYLTFDDGPTIDVTLWVLDTLDRYNAKATFFCIAKNIEHNPEIYEDILSRGHSIGNHSYSHIKGWGTKFQEYIDDITLSEEYIKSNLYRPPYARSTRKQIRKLAKRYHIILWTILSRDYSRHVTPIGCAKNVTNNLKDGAIIVFHDSNKAEKNMKYALIKTLDMAAEKGFKCKKIVLEDKLCV